MKKKDWPLTGLAAVVLTLGIIVPATSSAEVSVSISIPLPRLVFPGPPVLTVVPGSYVYYAPEVDVDIFFYQGYWYRPYRGGWYIASGYNGPWRAIGPRRVPRRVLGLPPGYRRLPQRHGRVPYREVRSNWRNWENERRWDDHGPDRVKKYKYRENHKEKYSHGKHR